MSRHIECENLPEPCGGGGLPVVGSGLHAVEHQDEGKEAWVYQHVVAGNPTLKENQSKSFGGLKPWLFWSILVVVSIVVIAASVGGAVGGSLAVKGNRKNAPPSSVQSAPTAILLPSTGGSSDRTSSGPPSFSSSKPTSVPPSLVTTDCPASNSTSFTPRAPSGNPGQYGFIKHCGFDTDGRTLIKAFVLDLNTCLALCSNWNYLQAGGDRCNSVAFKVNEPPPGNCWAKTGTSLKLRDGVTAALLQ